MAYKDYYEYKDIIEATGKSYSAVKKWRISIERLSGYEFKKDKTCFSGAIFKAYKFLLNSLDRLHELYLLSDNLTFSQNSHIIKLLHLIVLVNACRCLTRFFIKFSKFT